MVAALGLWGTGSAVVVHGLSCFAARGIFLDQGLNPSPTLAGGFFTTKLSGKPYFLLNFFYWSVGDIQCCVHFRGTVK